MTHHPTPLAAHRRDTGLAEPITIPRGEYHRLLADADSWRALHASPHCAEIIAEYLDWHARRDLSASTAAMASLHDWARLANAPTYRELQRRRAVPVVPVRCATRGCRQVLSVPYPAPRHDVHCPAHRRSTRPDTHLLDRFAATRREAA